MENTKKLQALHSSITLQYGDTSVNKDLSEIDINCISDFICTNTGYRLSSYYSLHPEQWILFLEAVKEA